MPLGMEVGLGPGAFLLDGDQAPSPPQKRARFPPSRSHLKAVFVRNETLSPDTAVGSVHM